MSSWQTCQLFEWSFIIKAHTRHEWLCTKQCDTKTASVNHEPAKANSLAHFPPLPYRMFTYLPVFTNICSGELVQQHHIL